MYLLGYDIGSSSIKCALVDSLTGKCIASAFAPASEAPIKAVNPSWAEQAPESWWTYLKEATEAVLSLSAINSADIKAVGISYQMHGLVLVDKELKPLRDAIIWCDSRGVPYGDRAFTDIGHQTCLTHLLNSPGNFTASKLQWVKRHEPELFDRIYKIMLPGDYIAMRLTGQVCTTVSGLSEMMLWDFKNNCPARFLLDYFGYSTDILPDIVPTFGEQGQLTRSIASELGLTPGIPVAYRAGDQPNNALSLNVFNPGEIASTAGTSGVVYGVISSTGYDSSSRVNNFAHVNYMPDQPRIGVLACINGTGILNSWVKHNFMSPDVSYDNMNQLAAMAPVGSNGVTILPFGNGAERLLENKSIGCSFHNIDFNRHSINDIVRAAQEGIVFAFMYGIEIMTSMGLSINRINAGNANMFLSPVFRDTLAGISGATITLYDTDGAVGAAKAAGIGVGIYADHNEAFATLAKIAEITPPADRTSYIEAYARWTDVLSKSLQSSNQ